MEVVYHESQQSGFCGLHSINNVLQGPIFSVFDLSAIALQLDAEERALLDEANEAGENVAMDGNFSIQVLRKALSMFNVEMIRLGSEEADALGIPVENQDGFICNFNDHWFAIRKVKGKFYNLDSLKNKPVIVSHTYLSLFLNQLQMEGYDIFVLVGNLPAPDVSKMTIESHGSWWDIESINNLSNASKVEEPQDDDLDLAIAASMSLKTRSPDDEDMELAIKISMESQ